MDAMITADQILAHLVGDYLTQSNWMATEKVRRWIPAAAHATVYSLGFLFFHPSPAAWLVILGSHLLIDRFRLARYLVWAKNLLLAPPLETLELTAAGLPAVSATGYPDSTPTWLAVWLLIIADNIVHLTVNGLALKFL